MAMREQIITLKVRYDDGEENVCSDEESCCGVGNCDERTPPPSEDGDLLDTDIYSKYEVLNSSPAREV